MKRLLVAIFLLGVATPTVGADKDSPYLIDKRDFKKQYKTIALSPAYADPFLQMPDSVGRTIEAAVTRHLEKRGFTVLPPSVLGDIRARMGSWIGGTTDPATGEVDTVRQEVVHTHAYRELWFKHQLDAVAMIRVRVRQVPIENDSAKWDGTKQRIEHSGGTAKYAVDGWVSSVSIAVFDDKQEPLYTNRGGLEVLMRRESGQLTVLPVEQYFQDEQRILKATQIALKPI